MNTKLVLQILLTLGCVSLAVSVVQATLHPVVLRVSTQGWWQGAMACWMLIVAIRMVYPAKTK